MKYLTFILYFLVSFLLSFLFFSFSMKAIAATTFYLPSSSLATPISPTPYSVYVANSSSFARILTTTSKTNTAMTNFGDANVFTVNTDQAFAQFVSQPLAAGTISGTMSHALFGFGEAGSYRGSINIRVMRPTGALRGNIIVSDPGTWLGTGTTFVNAAAISSVTAVAGDYLVIDIGFFDGYQTATTSSYLVFGDNGSTNYGYTATDSATGKNGTVYFSATIAFQATKLAFTTQPSTTNLTGLNFATQPVVTVQSSTSGTVTGGVYPVTLAAFTASNCTGTPAGTLSVATNPLLPTSGVATFSGVSYSGTDSIYLCATATGLTQAVSNQITMQSATPYQLAFTTQPSTTGKQGLTLATQPVVAVQNSSGTTIPNATNSVTLAAYTDAACTISDSGTVAATTNPLNASSGVATFAGVNYYGNTGTIYIGATSSGLVTACSGAITISGTLFYLPSSSAAPPISPAASGAWAGIASNFTHVNMPITKTSTAITAQSTSVSAVQFGFRQYISPPLAAQTISGSIYSSLFGIMGSSGSQAMYVIIKAFAPDGVTVRGTLLYFTSYGSQTFTASPGATSYINNMSLTSVAVSAGDYLDVELGVQDFNATETDQLFFGDNASSNYLYTGSTTTTGKNPTIMFSSNITFITAVPYQVAVYQQPSSTGTSGVNLSTQPAFSIQDSSANIISSATNPITIAAYTDSGCTNAVPGTLAVAVNPLTPTSGVSTFSGVNYTYTSSGTIYIGASASGLISACSSGVLVASTTPYQLSFSTQPSDIAVSTVPLFIQPSVSVNNDLGTLLTGASNSILLNIYTDDLCTNLDTGTLDATANPLSATSGIANFDGVTYTGDSTPIYLGATSSGLVSTCSTLIDFHLAPINSLILMGVGN